MVIAHHTVDFICIDVEANTTNPRDSILPFVILSLELDTQVKYKYVVLGEKIQFCSSMMLA